MSEVVRINAINRSTKKAAAFDDSGPGPAGPAETNAAKVARVAKLLGVDDPNDKKAIRAALDKLLGDGGDGSSIAAACLRAVKKMPHMQAGQYGLTAREMQKCKAKGIDPKKYAATKASMTNKGG